MYNVGLYLYILIIGHNSYTMLVILNKLTLQKKLQNCVTNNVFLDKTVKSQQQQRIKHKNPCWSRELNPGSLAPRADALPMHHRVT